MGVPIYMCVCVSVCMCGSWQSFNELHDIGSTLQMTLHTHTLADTYTYADSFIRTHTQTSTHTHSLTHRHTHTHAHTFIHTSAHTHTLTYVRSSLVVPPILLALYDHQTTLIKSLKDCVTVLDFKSSCSIFLPLDLHKQIQNKSDCC